MFSPPGSGLHYATPRERTRTHNKKKKIRITSHLPQHNNNHSCGDVHFLDAVLDERVLEWSWGLKVRGTHLIVLARNVDGFWSVNRVSITLQQYYNQTIPGPDTASFVRIFHSREIIIIFPYRNIILSHPLFIDSTEPSLFFSSIPQFHTLFPKR